MHVVLSTGSVAGGSWNRLVELLGYLSKKGHRCDLITYDDSALDVIEGQLDRLTVHRLDVAKDKRGTFSHAKAAARHLDQISWSSNEPVWLGSYVANAGLALSKFKNKSARPIQMFTFLRGAELRRIEMNLEKAGVWGLRRAAHVQVHKRVTRQMLRSSDLLIAQTDVGLEEIHSNFSSAMPNALEVLPNNINASWIEAKLADVEAFASFDASRPLRIGFVGRINIEVKGLDTLVEACRQIRERLPVTLELIGDGSDMERLRSMLDAADLTSVTRLHGWVSNPLPLLAQTDAIIVPSRADPLPNVVLEGLAMARPVFGANVDGIPVMLKHDELLFPAGNADALAERLIRFATNDAFRLRVGSLVTERADAFRFDWGARFEDILINHTSSTNGAYPAGAN